MRVMGFVGIFSVDCKHEGAVVLLFGGSCCIILFSLYITLERGPFVALEGEQVGT
jgi:hypothetical protein